MNPAEQRPPLRLVRSRPKHAMIGTVRLSLAGAGDDIPCDAVVLEEDTWQIMAAGSEPSNRSEHPIRLWTGIINARPQVVGTVLRRDGNPLTMLAIIHDFEKSPCCRPRWIADALADIFRICRERHIRSLLLPLLGVRHGRLSPRRAFRLVVTAINMYAQGELCRVLLECPGEQQSKLRELFDVAGVRE